MGSWIARLSITTVLWTCESMVSHLRRSRWDSRTTSCRSLGWSRTEDCIIIAVARSTRQHRCWRCGIGAIERGWGSWSLESKHHSTTSYSFWSSSFDECPQRCIWWRRSITSHTVSWELFRPATWKTVTCWILSGVDYADGRSLHSCWPWHQRRRQDLFVFSWQSVATTPHRWHCDANPWRSFQVSRSSSSCSSSSSSSWHRWLNQPLWTESEPLHWRWRMEWHRSLERLVWPMVWRWHLLWHGRWWLCRILWWRRELARWDRRSNCRVQQQRSRRTTTIEWSAELSRQLLQARHWHWMHSLWIEMAWSGSLSYGQLQLRQRQGKRKRKVSLQKRKRQRQRQVVQRQEQISLATSRKRQRSLLLWRLWPLPRRWVLAQWVLLRQGRSKTDATSTCTRRPQVRHRQQDLCLIQCLSDHHFQVFANIFHTWRELSYLWQEGCCLSHNIHRCWEDCSHQDLEFSYASWSICHISSSSRQQTPRTVGRPWRRCWHHWIWDPERHHWERSHVEEGQESCGMDWTFNISHRNLRSRWCNTGTCDLSISTGKRFDGHIFSRCSWQWRQSLSCITAEPISTTNTCQRADAVVHQWRWPFGVPRSSTRWQRWVGDPEDFVDRLRSLHPSYWSRTAICGGRRAAQDYASHAQHSQTSDSNMVRHTSSHTQPSQQHYKSSNPHGAWAGWTQHQQRWQSTGLQEPQQGSLESWWGEQEDCSSPCASSHFSLCSSRWTLSSAYIQIENYPINQHSLPRWHSRTSSRWLANRHTPTTTPAPPMDWRNNLWTCAWSSSRTIHHSWRQWRHLSERQSWDLPGRLLSRPYQWCPTTVPDEKICSHPRNVLHKNSTSTCSSWQCQTVDEESERTRKISSLGTLQWLWSAVSVGIAEWSDSTLPCRSQVWMGHWLSTTSRSTSRSSSTMCSRCCAQISQLQTLVSIFQQMWSSESSTRTRCRTPLLDIWSRWHGSSTTTIEEQRLNNRGLLQPGKNLNFQGNVFDLINVAMEQQTNMENQSWNRQDSMPTLNCDTLAISVVDMEENLMHGYRVNIKE